MVTYLGDDDLLFPHHIETMVALLDEHDFAHPFPVCVDKHDVLTAYPSDLSDPECVAWHLERGWNTIGLTGAAQTVEVYRRLPQGWTEPPSGWWSDHFFWTQIFRMPDVRLATSVRATVIKSPSASWSDEPESASRSWLDRWLRRIVQTEFAQEWDLLVANAIRRSAVTNAMWVVRHDRTIGELRKRIVLTNGAGEV